MSFPRSPCISQDLSSILKNYFDERCAKLLKARTRCEAFLETKRGKCIKDDYLLLLYFEDIDNDKDPIAYGPYSMLPENTNENGFFYDTVKILREKTVYKC